MGGFLKPARLQNVESGDGALTVTVLGAQGWEAWVQEMR